MNYTRANQIEDQAKDFITRHPRVWELFCDFTFEMIGRGFKNYSAYAISERIRWELDSAGDDGQSNFKLNNNYRPYFARWFMDQHPEHEGFFRIRKLTSEESDPSTLPELGPQDYPYINQ